jgi:1-phosphofructokinase
VSNDEPAERPATGEDDRPTVAIFAPVLMLLVELHRTGDEETEVHLHAGGQGYWIARMVNALGGKALPCAPAGGEPGVALRAIVEGDGLTARLTSSAMPNAVWLEDWREGTRTAIAQTPIPSLGRHDSDELYSATVGAALRASVCVLAGAHMAPVVSDDTFRRLVADLRGNGVCVIADVSGPPLRAALRSGVDIVKLSHEEMLRDGWATGDSVNAIAEGIRKVRKAGAGAVVVSRSDRSTVAGYDDSLVEVRPPRLEVLDGRGGGDSMTAALAVASSRGLGFEDALRLAAAAGSLNVSRHGLGTGRRDTIEEIAALVEVHPARARSGRRNGAAALEARSKSDLLAAAREHDIPGRSSMTKAQLIGALREADG